VAPGTKFDPVKVKVVAADPAGAEVGLILLSTGAAPEPVKPPLACAIGVEKSKRPGKSKSFDKPKIPTFTAASPSRPAVSVHQGLALMLALI
jgi:hypothetical protein